ncbi:hypothetical protein BHE74_00017724 [Ensete ventricosum]|nr:hypothetical protein BHE74_00017724 [Ensete ventricosum]RZS23007.1 hypothetical protein BHM03_00055847 [Ensete ventricosum]
MFTGPHVFDPLILTLPGHLNRRRASRWLRLNAVGLGGLIGGRGPISRRRKGKAVTSLAKPASPSSALLADPFVQSPLLLLQISASHLRSSLSPHTGSSVEEIEKQIEKLSKLSANLQAGVCTRNHSDTIIAKGKNKCVIEEQQSEWKRERC